MSSKLMLILMLLHFGIVLHSIVIVEEVNIDSEFYGPLSKNTAEFILYNKSDNIDDGNCFFKLNSSAFISKLLLEIDGKLVQDETFELDTRTKGNLEITRDNPFPVLLIKGPNGNYSLRAGPFDKLEKKRLIIEYYSILETIENKLTWLFKINDGYQIKVKAPMAINFNSRCNIPENTKILANDHVVYLTNDKLLNLSNKKELTINFQYNFNSQESKRLRIFDDNNEIIEIPEINKVFNKIQHVPDIPIFVKNFINDYSYTDYQIYREVIEDDIFLKKFISYIEAEHTFNSPFYQIYGNWFSDKTKITYNDENIHLITNSHELSNYDSFYSIFCPFLNEFYKFLSIQYLENKEQAKSKFLTRNTAKIILNKNKQTVNTKDRILVRDSGVGSWDKETKLISNSDPDQGPILVKRVLPDYSEDLLRLLEVDGTVYVNFEVLEDGKVGQVEVIESPYPYLNNSIVKAIKQQEYVPAKTDGKNVSFYAIRIPMTIKYNETESKKEIQNDRLYNIFGRELKPEINTLFEIEFDKYHAKSIKLYSKDFFYSILKYPELVNITYYFGLQNKYSQIGLVTDSKKSIFIMK